MGGRQAHRRARDDSHALPGLRPCPLRRLPPVGDRGRGRIRRRAPARLRALPAGGAAGLSVLDHCPLGDHRRDRPPGPGAARARDGALPRRAVRAGRAGGATGDLRRRALRLALAKRWLPTLALGLGHRRLDRSRRARGRRRDRPRCRRGPQVRRVVRRHRLPEAARLRPRRLVARGDDARARRAAARGYDRRFLLPAGSLDAGRPRVRRRRCLRVDRLRRVRGSEGRVPFDGLLAAGRRAERDLPRPDRVRRDRGGSRTSAREPAGARPRLRRRGLPRRARGAPARPVPLLRGAEPRDRAPREPELHLGRGRRRAGARRDRDRLGRAPGGADARPLAHRRPRDRRRRRLRRDRLGADDGDLRCPRPQHVLRADAPDLAQARRLGRPGHRRRADALPRAAARQGHEPDLAARVLELLDRQDLEPGRDRAAPVALAQPGCAGRDDWIPIPASTGS